MEELLFEHSIVSPSGKFKKNYIKAKKYEQVFYRCTWQLVKNK